MMHITNDIIVHHLHIFVLPGPSKSTLCQGDMEKGFLTPAFVGISLEKFRLEQLCHETLRHTFYHLRVINGQNFQPLFVKLTTIWRLLTGDLAPT